MTADVGSTFQDGRRGGWLRGARRVVDAVWRREPLTAVAGDRGPAAPRAGAPRSQRDLRLDLFRGLALLFIFIDHTTFNVVASFTLQGFAFCDAAEIFIFVAGVAAALAYGGILERRGPVEATARIYRRIWQLYVAHVFVFMAFTALVTFVLKAARYPGLIDTLGMRAFLSHPSRTIAELLVLNFQPGLFFILPLYMLLLAVFPPILALIRRRPLLVLGLSATVYVAARALGVTFYLYPDHHPWQFNPLAYQFLFITGAVCGCLTSSGRRLLPDRGWIYAVAGMIVTACAVVSFDYSLHSTFALVPSLLSDASWASLTNKRDLAPLRLINFFALAILSARLLRRDAAFLSGPIARPLVLCGQNSLPLFCLSNLLSTAGYFILVEITDRLRMQLLVSVVGVAIMIAAAYLLTWQKQMGRASAAIPALATAE